MRAVKIFYSFLIRLFAGLPFFFILGFRFFGSPVAATAQGVLPQETLVPEISVTIANRYDPQSLPVNITRPDNHPLPFDENGMRAIVTSLAYLETKGGGSLGQSRMVFSSSVADRLAPVLWRAFQGLRREEVVFFRVWGGAVRTTGMVFMAGTKIYWRFGLINGVPHENLLEDGLGERDREPPSARYWRPAEEEKDAAGRTSRYFVTDIKTPAREREARSDSASSRVTYLISAGNREEVSASRYKQIYGKVWWKKRSRDEKGEEREQPIPTPPLPKTLKERGEERSNALLARYHEIKKMHREGSLSLEEYQRQREALIRGEKVEKAPERVEVAAMTPVEEFRQPYEAPKDETYREHPDHLEGFNRAMFTFNDFFYENLLKPVSTVYSEVTDEDFRSIVANFFRNLAMPVRLVSCLIQGEGEKAGRTLTRFVINTVLTGGMVDVAKTEFGMEEVDENFDQALGRHGVGTGSYVVWPVAGPSSVRGTFGMVADTLLKPFWFLGIGTVNYTALGGGERINETALNLGFKEDIDQMAIDPYLSVRDLYFQHTQGKVKE